MFLQEEYVLRHRLKGVCLIHHVREGSLLLKTGNTFTLMQIKWQDVLNHPGEYHIDFFEPVHNGYVENNYFAKVGSRSAVVDWAEYRNFLREWCKNPGGSPVTGEREAALAAWQVFMFCADDLIASCRSPNVKNAVFEVVDEQRPLSHRYAAYQDLLIHLTLEQQRILRAFRYNYIGMLRSYCHWLGRLALLRR